MINQTPEERLAALENEKKHDQKFQDEVRITLRKLPSRIAKQTRRQIEECQRRNVEICGSQAASPAVTSTFRNVNKTPEASLWEMVDSKNIVKLLLICIVVGGLVGGFVYQYRNPDHQIIDIVQPK